MSNFPVYRPHFPDFLAKTLQLSNKAPHTANHVAGLDYNCPQSLLSPPQVITVAPLLLQYSGTIIKCNDWVAAIIYIITGVDH